MNFIPDTQRPTGAQTVTLIVIGAVLWFAAALLMQAIEPLGAFQGLGVVLLYALVIPGTYPFILLTRKLARLRRNQTVMGVAIVTAAAALLDGMALVVVPSLYGANGTGAGAAILWGVGVGLVLSVLMNERDDQKA